jgi:hypothetical protein
MIWKLLASIVELKENQLAKDLDTRKVVKATFQQEKCGLVDIL